MADYPKVITPEMAEKQSHISDEKIQQDIDDTEAEIITETKKAQAFELLLESSTSQNERRMNSFRKDAAEAGVEKRRLFVAFLKLLQEYRIQNRK